MPNLLRTNTRDDWWAREQEMRHRLLGHVKQHLTDSMVNTATDAFQGLLVDAHEEMVEELLRPIFEWSDFWPKRLATEILDLPTDEEYEWEELLEGFEAREQQEDTKASGQSNWTKEGF